MTFPQDPTTARRTFTMRVDTCCVCGTEVHSASATTTDPEAPEMINLPPYAWFGIVRDEPGGEARLIVSCSENCLRNLLKEGP